MRRRQLKQIQELIKTIHEVHEEIKNALLKHYMRK